MRELFLTRHNDLVDPVLHVWGWEIPVYLFLGGWVAGMMAITGYCFLRGRQTERHVRLRGAAGPEPRAAEPRHAGALPRPRAQALRVAAVHDVRARPRPCRGAPGSCSPCTRRLLAALLHPPAGSRLRATCPRLDDLALGWPETGAVVRTIGVMQHRARRRCWASTPASCSARSARGRCGTARSSASCSCCRACRLPRRSRTWWPGTRTSASCSRGATTSFWPSSCSCLGLFLVGLLSSTGAHIQAALAAAGRSLHRRVLGAGRRARDRGPAAHPVAGREPPHRRTRPSRRCWCWSGASRCGS